MRWPASKALRFCEVLSPDQLLAIRKRLTDAAIAQAIGAAADLMEKLDASGQFTRNEDPATSEGDTR
jgi:hypothetical protein